MGLRISDNNLTRYTQNLKSYIDYLHLSPNFGENNTNTGSYALVAGSQNTNTGDWSYLFGYKNKNTTYDSAQFGRFNVNSGRYSIQTGRDNENSGLRSASFGFGLYNSNDDCTVVGKYNKDVAGNLFVVGNGKSTARKNILEVSSSKVTVNGTLDTTDDLTVNADLVVTNDSTFNYVTIKDSLSVVNDVDINNTLHVDGQLTVGVLNTTTITDELINIGNTNIKSNEVSTNTLRAGNTASVEGWSSGTITNQLLIHSNCYIKSRGTNHVYDFVFRRLDGDTNDSSIPQQLPSADSGAREFGFFSQQWNAGIYAHCSQDVISVAVDSDLTLTWGYRNNGNWSTATIKKYGDIVYINM